MSGGKEGTKPFVYTLFEATEVLNKPPWELLKVHNNWIIYAAKYKACRGEIERQIMDKIRRKGRHRRGRAF